LQIDRAIMPRLARLAGQFPVLVLSGARQSGKTTVLRRAFPDHRYVSLDLPSAAEKAEREPERFLAELPPPVLIDEVQCAPRLFRHLKLAVDGAREQPGRFVLTGSQKLNLMREITDSLAGRCALARAATSRGPRPAPRCDHGARPLPRVVAGARPERVRLLRGLRGRLPRARRAPAPQCDELRDFERFVRILAARSGQVLNKSDVARDVGVSGTAITQWLSVLQASNLIVLLEPYFQNIGKRMIKSPKVYFTDPGLLCFLLGLDEASLTVFPV
jgi:hypothetical protein